MLSRQLQLEMGIGMGKLFVVGIGPGGADGLTIRAERVLREAEVFFGYTLYIELLRPLFPGKEMVSTGMTGEAERCRMALERAQRVKAAALVCSGDAGIYGLAGLVLELSPDYPEVEIEIVPGVTAAVSGAALLGAPLGHDFCVISLSDRLTEWSVIEKRLLCAAEGDFVLCLYNPASRHRKDTLRRACEILLKHREASTVCAIARSIGREGESFRILSLRQLSEAEADMFSTVFVGSSRTKEISGRMVTPRGYRL